MTAGRWANAPAGEQIVREGALGTLHGNSSIPVANPVGVGCTLLAGKAFDLEARQNDF